MDDQSHPVASVRLDREVRNLEQRYRTWFDRGERTIVLDEISLPEGWTPQPITVRIDLPDHWPRTAPRLVFPWNLRYKRCVPSYLLNSGQWLVRGTLGDPFIFWPADWDPQTTTLRNVVETALTDLTRRETTAKEGG